MDKKKKPIEQDQDPDIISPGINPMDIEDPIPLENDPDFPVEENPLESPLDDEPEPGEGP